jgi:hypothetical protein
LREKNSYRANCADLFVIAACSVAISLKRLAATGSGRFRDFARLDATGANLLALDAALRALDADGLQIRVEAAARAIVRVGNIITELRPFATDFASFSHDYSVPPSIKSRMRVISVKNQRI